jgi:hypothetical protein
VLIFDRLCYVHQQFVQLGEPLAAVVALIESSPRQNYWCDEPLPTKLSAAAKREPTLQVLTNLLMDYCWPSTDEPMVNPSDTI